jgi:hypothetical protein
LTQRDERINPQALSIDGGWSGGKASKSGICHQYSRFPNNEIPVAHADPRRGFR